MVISRGHNRFDTPRRFGMRYTIGESVTTTAHNSFLMLGVFLKIKRLEIEQIYQYHVHFVG